MKLYFNMISKSQILFIMWHFSANRPSATHAFDRVGGLDCHVITTEYRTNVVVFLYTNVTPIL